jgi:predicted ester cyclase
VAARLTARGTHQGLFIGVPATGREINVEVMNFFRLDGDKIAEEWAVMNTMGLLQQIRAIPGA